MSPSETPPQRTVYLAAPRGFCAGVDRAIEVVETSLRIYGTPLYVNHEIVHNRHVVDDLRSKGVIFVDSLETVPDGKPVVFSAHGVSPALWERAREKSLDVIDATCPLVTKVHLEARRYAREGYTIILIGHRNHVEARGTQGEAPDQIRIIEDIKEVEDLDFPPDAKLAYLTQTTLSVRDTSGIIARLREKFPNIEGPASSDICYATTNRQSAVEAIATQVELFLVVGSANSSNSNRLAELSETLGTPARLIDQAEDIRPEWLTDISKVGLTAGASAPEVLIKSVLARLKAEFDFQKVEEVTVTRENVVFKLPKELREAGV